MPRRIAFDELIRFDRLRLASSVRILAGVDEAGRGALAGPVVAAAVVCEPCAALSRVRDSKLVSERERERLYDCVIERCAAWGIGVVESGDIDRMNILRATLQAMRAAVEGLAVAPDLESWDSSVKVDLMAAVRACGQVIPWMEASGGGSILLVSSISGLEVSPSPDFAYSTVKAALIAYAKKLAIAHGAKGVRVNSIAPGSIDFPGGTWDRVKQHQPGLYQRVCSAIPAGRMGTPEEVADVAVFLCSPRAGWITGECVAVDGGQHKAMR